MTTTGLYLPGRSWLHRLPAGAKLAGLVACGVATVLLDEPWQVGLAVLLVLAGFASAAVPPRLVLRQVRPLLWVVVALLVFHGLATGWSRAVVVTGVLVTLVLLASLVTLTTRTTDLLDVVERGMSPLRRVGVDPARAGLLLALGIRSVPVVVGIAEEVRDAQRARGLTASPRAFAVPLIVRSIRHADRVGEALVARGLDD